MTVITRRGPDALTTSYEVVAGADAKGGGTDSSVGHRVANEADLWDDAINSMLTWVGQDDLDPKCVETALDFAMDQREEGVSPPSSIAPTEDGGICFEWKAGLSIHVFDVVDRGRIEYVYYRDCRVIETGVLLRDPKTRRLELAE